MLGFSRWLLLCLLLLSFSACSEIEIQAVILTPTANQIRPQVVDTQVAGVASPTLLLENTEPPSPTITITPVTTSATEIIATGAHQTPNECIQLTPTPPPSANALLLEVEDYNTDPQRYRGRRNASNNQTVSMLDEDNLSIPLDYVGNATMLVRYSNDSAGPLEVVELRIIGQTTRVFTFSAFNTRRPGMRSGEGLECFQTVAFGDVTFSAQDHTLEVRVTGGDGFGVELDVILLQ